MKGIWLLVIVSLFIFFPENDLWSQNNHDYEEIKHHSELKGTSRLTVGIGHTNLSEGKIDGKTEWLTLPSWVLNYDNWISNKWAIKLQNNIALDFFFIENGDNELLGRSYPIF